MYQQKKDISVQLVILFGLFLVSSMFFKYASEVYRDYEVNQEIRTLEKDIAQLKGENSELHSYLQYLETPAYREIVAKTHLNMKRPGEKVFRIQNQGEVKEIHTFGDGIRESDLMPIYLKWWRLFVDPSERV